MPSRPVSLPPTTSGEVPCDAVTEQLFAETLAAKDREIKGLMELVEQMEAHCHAMAKESQQTIDNILDANRHAFETQKRIFGTLKNRPCSQGSGSGGGGGGGTVTKTPTTQTCMVKEEPDSP